MNLTPTVDDRVELLRSLSRTFAMCAIVLICTAGFFSLQHRETVVIQEWSAVSLTTPLVECVSPDGAWKEACLSNGLVTSRSSAKSVDGVALRAAGFDGLEAASPNPFSKVWSPTPFCNPQSPPAPNVISEGRCWTPPTSAPGFVVLGKYALFVSAMFLLGSLWIGRTPKNRLRRLAAR